MLGNKSEITYTKAKRKKEKERTNNRDGTITLIETQDRFIPLTDIVQERFNQSLIVPKGANLRVIESPINIFGKISESRCSMAGLRLSCSISRRRSYLPSTFSVAQPTSEIQPSLGFGTTIKALRRPKLAPPENRSVSFTRRSSRLANRRGCTSRSRLQVAPRAPVSVSRMERRTVGVL